MQLRILPLIFFFGLISSCQDKVTKQEQNNENVSQQNPVENEDEIVLQKLWTQEQFRNNKENKFRSLDDAYAYPEKVVNLAVYSGFKGEIPEDIDRFKNVQLIGMSNNKLTKLPESIGNLVYLQEVHLNKNAFTEFPEPLTNNRYLRTILISDNNITYITPKIKNLVHLKNLVMNDNEISNIPVEIFELTNLKVLALRNNGIKELPDKFDQLPFLEKLNLQNNNLTVIPESIKLSGSNLKKLTLRGNPMSGSYVEELRKMMPDTEIEF